jgi:DAACS family dicarboxylate/amino acid:cation (Na+ or H+) symporter
MIVIPLVFCAAASGTLKIALEARDLGRMAVVASGWFIVASLAAIALGLALDAAFHPGRGVLPPRTLAALPPVRGASLAQVLLDAIPGNVVAAMAQQKVLPTLVFAVLFGLALGSLGAARAKPMADVLDTVLAAMFRMTRWVVALAPIAVLATVASLLATQSVAMLWALGKLVLIVYLGYLIFGLLCVGGLRLLSAHPLRLAREMLAPALLGFVTRSSEVALPLHMEKLEQAGFSNRIVSVVLPLGYSFNLDGAALYLGLATPFLAETYGLDLSLAQRLTVLATGLLASKGVANVPSSALVALSTVVLALGLPPESIALIAGVDVFLDLGRTALNVFCNTLSVLVVERSRAGRR